MDATAFHARRAAAEHRGCEETMAQDAASEPEPLGHGRITPEVSGATRAAGLRPLDRVVSAHARHR